MSQEEINELIQKINQSGSERAFRDFYNLCYDRLYRIAYYYVKNEMLSQEVVLDAFTKLWEKRDTLSDIQNIDDYCFILVKNISLNYLAKENRNASESLETGVEQESSHASPEETLISEELFALYVKALDQLPERCREVFIRIREEGQSYAQVAKEMEISTKTVDAQLQKAQSRLRTIISAYFNSAEE